MEREDTVLEWDMLEGDGAQFELLLKVFMLPCFRMPIQAPQWTEFLSCPVCCNEFDATLRSPVSLACAHTVCKTCLVNLHRKQCPFDQVSHGSFESKLS